MFTTFGTDSTLYLATTVDMARYKVEVFPNVVNVHEYNDCIECN